MSSKLAALRAIAFAFVLVATQAATAQVHDSSAKPAKDTALKPGGLNTPAKKVPGESKLTKLPYQYVITKTDSTKYLELRAYVLNKGAAAEAGGMRAKVSYMREDTSVPRVDKYVVLTTKGLPNGEKLDTYWDASAEVPALKPNEGAWITLKFSKPMTIGLILKGFWGKPPTLGAEISASNGKTQMNGAVYAVSAVYLDKAFFTN